MTVIIICLIALALHLYRQHVTTKKLSGLAPVEFEGDLYCVGETVFAIRNQGEDVTRTIVCFPGFTETMSYFTRLYSNIDCQLILVNNALYHSPFDLSHVTALDWESNPYEPGTIQYDGFYLARIIRDYADHKEVFVNGHSRGGAVVLEAGRQFPEITRAEGKTVTALLEAAVVPGGTTVAPKPGKLGRALMSYVMPIVFNLSAKISRERLEKMPMMSPTNEHKTDMVMKNFRSPKYYWVYVKNVMNIPQWQEEQTPGLYEHFHKIILIQGQRDDVLVNSTMEASALEGAKLNDQVRIIKTENTNHFVALEQPDYIRELVAG